MTLAHVVNLNPVGDKIQTQLLRHPFGIGGCPLNEEGGGVRMASDAQP